MTIQIISWASPQLLEGTGYTHGQEVEGSDAVALGIAMELFMNGLNIRVTRQQSKCICKGECSCNGNILPIVRVAVDDKGFTQR